MRRNEKTFKALNEAERTALVTFIMAGDPDYENSLKVLKSLPESGADIIEVGMPFTDPAADGVTIQRAGQRALKNGANITRTIDMVKNFRSGNNTTPIILMGYANPIYSYGLKQFAKDAAFAGVDGLIIVDLPPEEDAELRGLASMQGLDMIRLITPTTDEKRLEKILDGACGFLYYVSITGVTGTAKANSESMKLHLDMIKSKTNLPIAIGFGIKTPNDAQEMSYLGDAVVVGSSIVDKIKDIGDNGGDISDVTTLVSSLSYVLGSRL